MAHRTLLLILWIALALTSLTGCAERPILQQGPTREQRLAELAALAEGAPVRGPADAPVTLVAFSDYQCPFCGRAATTLEELLEAYPGQVRLVHLDLPLPFHSWAGLAALAGVCTAAQSQQAFWTLYDGLFAGQQEITQKTVLDRSAELLAETDVDPELWNECVRQEDSPAHQAALQRLERQILGALALGVESTPTLFVDGEPLLGAQPFEVFEHAVQQALAQQNALH